MSGRPFLQIPGPTNIPDRVLRAMDRQVVDHRGPEFAALTESVRAGLREVFGTRDGVPILYAASGTGAIEATLVNLLAPGDRVLVYSYGVFSASLARMARKFQMEVDEVELRWGQTIPADDLAARLKADTSTNRYKALLVVHNETSTGVTVDIAAIRAAMDAAGHDALLIVDTVSSLASIDFRMDEWRVDVAVCGSQKGLMLPPGWASCAPASAPCRLPNRAAARRATSGTGRRSCARTASACSPTRPPHPCCLACARRWSC